MLSKPRPSTRLLAALAALAATAILAGCGDDGDSEGSDTPKKDAPSREATDVSCTYGDVEFEAAKDVDPPPEQATVSGQMPATIETSAGSFKVTLDADSAPCTVNSFVSLADQGYFDDTTCHRMVTSGIFVLQCGDPSQTGGGSPGYTVPDEYDGTEKYKPGTLAMANAGAPNTGGSQFFIVYGDSPLPPSYTVFGSVDDAAVEAIKAIAKDGTNDANGPGDGAPVTPVDIDSVTVA